MASVDDTTPDWAPEAGDYEPDGQVAEPDWSAATGRANDVQRFLRGLGLSARRKIEGAPLLAPLAALAREAVALRSLPDALDFVAEALGGARDAAGDRTGPSVLENVLRSGAAALAGGLGADGTASGTSEVEQIRVTLAEIRDEITALSTDVGQVEVALGGIEDAIRDHTTAVTSP